MNLPYLKKGYLGLITGMSTYSCTRGPDGFGSQMLAAFQGYLIAKKGSRNYCFRPISTIRLLNVGDSNDELDSLNSIISTTMSNLNIPDCSSVSGPIDNEAVPYGNVRDDMFGEEALKSLSNAWPCDPPDYYKDRFNIAVHIRRGGDIGPGEVYRWGDSKYYNVLIKDFLRIYPNAIVHTFSWNDPQIEDFPEDKVIKHISSKGGAILDHYNALIHSDILMVSSSTFSNSAALFNKNIVLVNPEIMHLTLNPYCSRWVQNYKDIENEKSFNNRN